MSRTMLSLPLRTASQLNQQSLLWTCRRCLATQAKSAASQSEFPPSLPANERRDAEGKVVPLQRRDWLLKKQLPHDIPRTRLVHSTTDILPPKEKAQRDSIPKHKRTVGVVIKAGLMDRTVTVRLPGQAWNKHIKKVGEAADEGTTW
jgi:small subunit ribosomal protein S17